MKHLWLLAAFLLNTAASVTAQSTRDTTISFPVEGSCGMCKQRIEKSLKVNGIAKASWSAATKLLTVTYDRAIIRLAQIHDRLAAAGHDTKLKKASAEVYKDLPDCCHYREDGADNESISHPPSDTSETIRGIVLSEDRKGRFVPLSGASVVWLKTGAGVLTDRHGVFALPGRTKGNRILVSYTGFVPDTITIEDYGELQVVLATHNTLASVKVTSRTRSLYVNTTSAFRTATISSKELLKAACCNLSESFETNPSVDVSYNDAVTGSKQIQLLGLSGIYSQLTVENMPGPRGLATALGLNSIAGPWVESIQLSKGTGSVVNGFESIAGQINVELKKPGNSEKLYANGYVNSMGKTDLNLNIVVPVSKRWSTMFLLHNDFQYTKTDFNNDSFRDQPTGNLFSAVNRWKYDDGKGWQAQLGVKWLNDDKIGGALDYDERFKLTEHHYGLGIKTRRYEAFGKLGYVFPEKKYQSIGLQLSAFRHTQDSYFGTTEYNARQDNLYANLIYQSIIGNTNHKFRTGVSVSSDKYNEQLRLQQFGRKEWVPGGFFEYTYTMNDRFTAVGGVRLDRNSLFGWFVTPRLNVRYEPIKGTTIRLSAGRGQRTANIFAENAAVLVSSRAMEIISSGAGKAYGLDPEVAWNKGISVDQKFRLFGSEAMLSLDYFRNDFTNQVVVDMEDPRSVRFYNLSGKSFSNSFQAELSFVPLKNLDVRLAYRWFDVKTSYGGNLLQRPLTAANRAFSNIAYEWKQWKFDYTLNLVGRKRLPSTNSNPDAYKLGDYSPSYATMNAQVSRSFGPGKVFELYVGVENLGNVIQQRAILGADQPFGPYFDASMVWGPVTGAVFYGGFRYTIR